jgi:cysteine desulfurase
MSIYLDYAAATPCDPRVRLAMEPYLEEEFYNPSSSYMAARNIRRQLNEARARVAYWLGARPTEIIFTAGATEATNIALHGVMSIFPDADMVVLSTEHDSVLATAARYGHKVAPVHLNGNVDMDALKSLIDDRTVLVSVSYANNEVGTIQPVAQIGQLLQSIRQERQKAGNELPIYFHTDASQAAGYLDLHASRLGFDLMTLNGGKIYGPKQTGLLYVKAGTRIISPINGGGQERGLRSGTENVWGIIGLAAALDLVQADRKETIAKCTGLRDELQRHIVGALPDTIVNGNLKKRLPNSLHLSWAGIDGERLVMLLDEQGVMAATGSACAANKQTASHVLIACGLKEDLLRGSLRLTLGAPTIPEDVEKAAEIIIRSVRSLAQRAY